MHLYITAGCNSRRFQSIKFLQKPSQAMPCIITAYLNTVPKAFKHVHIYILYMYIQIHTFSIKTMSFKFTS